VRTIDFGKGEKGGEFLEKGKKIPFLHKRWGLLEKGEHRVHFHERESAISEEKRHSLFRIHIFQKRKGIGGGSLAGIRFGRWGSRKKERVFTP